LLVPEAEKNVEAVLGLMNELGQVVSMVHADEIGQLGNAKARLLRRLKKGSNRFILKIPDNFLRPGHYYVGVGLFDRRLVRRYVAHENIFSFEVTHSNGLVFSMKDRMH